MSVEAPFGHAQGDGFVAVELPYDGEELSMVIVCPEPERFAEVEASLDADAVAAIVAAIEPTQLLLTMPKFRFEARLGLVPTLQSLGMLDAFDPLAADLSGIDGTRTLYVTDVLHKAYIGVNEAGTEAAAATAVIVGTTSVPPSVVIDSSFIFFIRDVATGAILFIGRVMDPTA
jgi:serpin B